MQYPKLSGQLAAKRAVIKRASVQLTDITKFTSSGKRIIRGWASTVRPDRVGDVVEPKGGKWTLPLPLLWQHSHKDPIGWVRAIQLRDNGLWIEAEFAEGFERADEIWRMVDAELINGFSIGFRSIKSDVLPTGGLRFKEWELLEVSCVVVPANADAKIDRKERVAPPLKHEAMIQVARAAGSVKLVRHDPGPGVKLIDPKRGSVKLIRGDGAIPLIQGGNRNV